jgi:hypothetical protein
MSPSSPLKVVVATCACHLYFLAHALTAFPMQLSPQGVMLAERPVDIKRAGQHTSDTVAFKPASSSASLEPLGLTPVKHVS